MSVRPQHFFLVIIHRSGKPTSLHKLLEQAWVYSSSLRSIQTILLGVSHCLVSHFGLRDGTSWLIRLGEPQDLGHSSILQHLALIGGRIPAANNIISGSRHLRSLVSSHSTISFSVDPFHPFSRDTTVLERYFGTHPVPNQPTWGLVDPVDTLRPCSTGTCGPGKF